MFHASLLVTHSSPTVIYTLSLHDALPISLKPVSPPLEHHDVVATARWAPDGQRILTASWDHTSRVWDGATDRKSTRLNSSHTVISYAVFCLKKKNKTNNETTS